MTLSMSHERRLHPRESVTKPCKLRDPLRLSFATGVTHDVSASGARVEIRRDRPFALGDRVDIAVQWTHGAVLSGSGMSQGVVRRIDHAEPGRQIIAIEVAPKATAHAA